MDEPKVTLTQRLIALLICGIVFLAVYQLAGMYASGLPYVPSFVFPFEKQMPFLPWMVIPYMTSGVFFILIFFAVRQRDELILLFGRMLFITVASGICFFLFPLRFSFPRPPVDSSFFSFFFQYLNTWDTPFNQAPSLHIAYACMFWMVLSARLTGYKKLIAGVWLLLMGISTLTIYQHHVIDVVTAFGLVCITCFIFPGHIRRNKRIAALYSLAALSLVILILFIYRDCLILVFFLIWLVVTLIRVGKAYTDTDARFLKREDGTISLFNKIICFAYIAVYKLIRYTFYRNKIPAITEIYPNVFIGPMPGNKDIPVAAGNIKVIDLTAELEESKTIRTCTDYYSCPMLDIASVRNEDTERIVELIAKLYVALEPEEKIYIHCLMGYSRSVFIATLFVRQQLHISSSDAIAYIQKKYPKAIYPYYI